MAVNVRWYDESQHILLYDFKGVWTLEEFSSAIDEAKKLVEAESITRLDIITDLIDSEQQKGMNQGHVQVAMNRSYRILPKEQFYLAVVASPHRFVSIMIDMMRRIYPPMHHVRTANSVEDAMTVIQREREAMLES